MVAKRRDGEVGDLQAGVVPAAGESQAALWNGVAGQAWVDAQAWLDAMFEPFAQVLADAVVADGATHVLDVGCGTGATTLAIAQRLGARGRCVGIDLSAPMSQCARARAARAGIAAAFVCADAQAHAFAPASFDAIVSRFGIMFFDDPLRAFTNLRRAARPAARLHGVVWRSAAENAFMTTAERALAARLPQLPARRSGAPGPFALADRATVIDCLARSGWTAIEVTSLERVCTLPVAGLSPCMTRLGPLGRVWPMLDTVAQEEAAAALQAAFAPYRQGSVLRFTAACWQVRARAPG